MLVDTSTDLRAQALAHRISRVDAILFTHSHADHILGLDEVRRFNVVQRSAIPCYGDERTLDDLRRTFSYIFDPPALGRRRPADHAVPDRRPVRARRLEIVPVPLLHGQRPILGFRIGDVRVPDRLQPHPGRVVAAARRRAHARARRAARSAAPDALQRRGSARRRGAPGARAHLLHAHLPRSAARRHLRAPARRRGVGL